MLKYGLAFKNKQQRKAVASKAATTRWENYQGQTRQPRLVRLNNIGTMLKVLGVAYETEYKFHPTRKFRFDYAIPDRKIAIEYEGIMSAKARHTSITGFSNDCEKYNKAILLGWRVLRFTVLHINSGLAFKQIEEIIK